MMIVELVVGMTMAVAELRGDGPPVLPVDTVYNSKSVLGIEIGLVDPALAQGRIVAYLMGPHQVTDDEDARVLGLFMSSCILSPRLRAEGGGRHLLHYPGIRLTAVDRKLVVAARLRVRQALGLADVGK